MLQAPDQEVSVLAMAVLANVLSYSDTLLLTDSISLDILGESRYERKISLCVVVMRDVTSLPLDVTLLRLMMCNCQVL